MNRRDFIKLSAMGTGAALAGVESLQGDDTPTASKSAASMVGMPICIAPLAQHELDPLFEDMQKRAGVNALFPFIYSHEPHRAGVSPSSHFHGGNYAVPNMQYYKDIPLTFEDMRAPEFGGIDVLARVIPVARKHGIRVFCFVLEDNQLPPLVARNWEPLYEVDHHGNRTVGHPGGPCFNNPLYQAFALGLVEDYARSYDIGGIMWGSERQSGLLNTLSLSQSSGIDVSRTTCFCEFCRKKGRDRGIDVERARRGYDEAARFVQNSRAGRAPRDGYFTEFWRLLMKYPEALAWENLWVTSRHEFKAALYRKIKAINPSLLFGWHIWQNMSFSPFQRAEEDYGVLAENCDFLRPAFYNNVAGARFLAFVKGASESVLGDLPPPETLDVLYHQLNYNEAPYDKLLAAGLSAEYVERETRRAVEGVADNRVQVWPGVDIDVPVEPGEGHCTPESVEQAVKAVFKGGAGGVILSRNYIEMKPADLSGAGAALRELGII